MDSGTGPVRVLPTGRRQGSRPALILCTSRAQKPEKLSDCPWTTEGRHSFPSGAVQIAAPATESTPAPLPSRPHSDASSPGPALKLELPPLSPAISGAPPFQEPCPALVPSPALPSLFPEFARFLLEEGGVSAPHSLHLQGGDRVACGFPSALLIAEGLSR